MSLEALVIGGGGREYELTRQLASSPDISAVYTAPGNAGTAELNKTTNVDISPTDIDKLVGFVTKKGIDLTVIGPDASIAAGVGNALRQTKTAVFGPTREAGRLESSKAYAADFMAKHGIPQPPSKVTRSLSDALAAIKGRNPADYVLKADGLAAGKGVVLPKTPEEAEQTLRDMFGGQMYDGAGKDAVVIQTRYHGPEVSAFVLSDGKKFIMLPFSQDHKRLEDGDKGPNTGGMGVCSPLPESIVGADQAVQIADIAGLTIDGCAKDGHPFQGVLFVGIMLPKETNGDPVVIEYNARFGDPETQAILPLLAASGVDVANLLLQAARGDVSKIVIPKIAKTALTVAMAASGYPDSPRKGDPIAGLDKTYPDVVVQHAGTKKKDGKYLTAGGRVLYVTGFGETPDQAAQHAYAAIGQQAIHFDGMQYRTDIGHQARQKF